MKADRLVTIDIVTVNTAQVRTSRVAYLLDQARAPRQYDPEAGCWITSRKALPDLLAYLQDRKRPVIVREPLL